MTVIPNLFCQMVGEGKFFFTSRYVIVMARQGKISSDLSELKKYNSIIL